MPATDEAPTPAQRRRERWGLNIAAQLKVCSLNVKQLQRALLAHDVDVTTQAIYSWLAGTTAPRPETQVVVAQVLHIPHHLLFPLEAAAS